MIPRRLFRAYHRAMVKRHLKRLEGNDRRMRFGTMLPDDAIDQYVDRSWDESDHVWFGVIQDGEIIAAVHIAQEEDKSKAELGLSVDPEWRGQQLGQALFDRAVYALKARDVRDVFMHCLAENAIIKRIARKNGMVMVTEYGETDADLILPESTPLDVSTNLIVEQMALYDNAVRNATGVWKKFYETA